jgi:hypothetical protein
MLYEVFTNANVSIKTTINDNVVLFIMLTDGTLNVKIYRYGYLSIGYIVFRFSICWSSICSIVIRYISNYFPLNKILKNALDY